MGLKNLSNIKFTPEQDAKLATALHSLAKFAILETFEPSYYAKANEHAMKALEKHGKVLQEYPEYYKEMFSNEEYTFEFLDAHIIVSALFLFSIGVDYEQLSKVLSKVQINRLSLLFDNMLVANDIIGSSIEKKRIRAMLLEYLSRLEADRGAQYCAFYAVKYKHRLQSLFASLRIKRKKLSPVWQELMDFLFINKTKREVFTFDVLKEVVKLRKQNKTKELLEKIKKLPFTTFHGYAYAVIKEAVFERTDLMSNNELRRYLRKVGETGKLDTEEAKEKVAERLKKAPSDLFSLLNAYIALVLEDPAGETIFDILVERMDEAIMRMKEIVGDLNVGVAVDVSANTDGYAFLLKKEFQEALMKGEPVPKWANITLRKMYGKNLILAYCIAMAANNKEMMLFNDTIKTVNLVEEELLIESFLEALHDFIPDGGSAPLYPLELLVAQNPDMIFIVSDFNENVPMKGAFKLRLAEIARSYKKPIFLLQTDVDVTELTSVEKVIFEEKLENVYIIPIRMFSQLGKIADTLELEEKIKKIVAQIIKTVNRRPDVEVFA